MSRDRRKTRPGNTKSTTHDCIIQKKPETRYAREKTLSKKGSEFQRS